MGSTITVDLDHPWLSPRQRAWLREIWSYSLTDSRAGVVELRSPAVRSARSLSRLAGALSTEITLAALDHQAGRLLLLHAAGVADPDTGRTVALVAPSGHGKTTAARVLGTKWGYVSDETVAVDPRSLRVAAHPKPLSVRHRGRLKDQLGPEALGLRPAPDRLTLGRIVLLTRTPELVGPPRLRPVGLSRALGELVPETSFLTRFDTPLAMLASVIAATGGVLRLEYADADQLLDLPPELLVAGRRTQTWSSGPRCRAREAVCADGALAVLLDGEPERVVVLEGIGPTVWRLSCDPDATHSDLVRAVVEQHGEPPDGSAEAAVHACQETLRNHGLLP